MNKNYVHQTLYAVYDSKGRLVKLYANQTWANRKAIRVSGHVETFINENYKFGIDMAAYVLRDKGSD